MWPGKIWKWNSYCRLGKVKLLIRNEVRAKDMGKKGKFEVIIQAGVINLAVYMQCSVSVRWGFVVGAVGT